VNRILLTVSGTMDPERPEQVRRGERPRADYLELSAALGADLLDHAGARRLARGPVGRLIERFGGRNLLLAWACFLQRKRYDLIFTDGEQVGIPLAWLLKFLGGNREPVSGRNAVARHAMVAHLLSVGKKMLFFDIFRVHSHIDLFFVYSSWQARFITDRWRVPAERVVLTPFMVDSRFFSLDQAPPSSQPRARRQICAVGLEYRDYPTLLAAVRGLPVDVVIAAASPWSKRGDTTEGARARGEIPANVTVKRFNQYELRQVYAASDFLVMPLYEVPFQAGVTAILEAMSMSRAVICSRTRGQTDVIIDGETGIYVRPGDPQALRQAIEALLARPDDAQRMGQAGRRLVEHEMDLDKYVERLAECAQSVIQGGSAQQGASGRRALGEAR
jgi:glycosyltransferase involved in cell wall biosynthesis